MIVKTPRTGHIRTLAERVAKHPRIQAAVQEALPFAIEDALREMFPDVLGDTIKLSLYRRKPTRERQQERDARIRAALTANQPVSVIALRENVSERHVFRVKARALTSPTP